MTNTLFKSVYKGILLGQKYGVTTVCLNLYSQTVLDHLRAEHPCMSYSDRLVTAGEMGTRLHSHPPPLPPDLTPVNVHHCLDLIYTPAHSVIKAPSCSIHRVSFYVSEVRAVGQRYWPLGSGLTWYFLHCHMDDGPAFSLPDSPDTAVMVILTDRQKPKL